MCGIVGVLDLGGHRPAEDGVRRGIEALRHRGPDGDGLAVSGPACFGHVRLAILGVHANTARQPVSQDGCLLSFNGEIYNFHDLDRDLAAQGVVTSGASDTETLFQCLRHWGVEKTLARLDGMYAFAFFDAAARRLHVARDPVGEKFVYFAQKGGRFWFASEMKALLAAGAASSAPNLARIDDFLYTAKVNGAETMFRDVTELEPGTHLSIAVGEDAPRIATHWRVEDALGETARDLGTVGADFSRWLDQTVASRAISDVPLGVLLSGGIDSQTVVDRLIATAGLDRLDLFFADNANESVSEWPDARLFIDHLEQSGKAPPLTIHRGLLAYESYMDILRSLTWNYDEPIQFFNSPLLGNLCALARDAGIKVLLSGEGSDELLYGYARFDRTRRLLEAEGSRQTKLANLYFGGGMHSVDLVRRLTAKVAAGAEETAPWRWLDRHLDQPLDRLQLVYSQKYRLQTLLQRQDRIGMAYGVEIRVPFVRPAFVDWVNRLPESLKFDPATARTKVLLRNVMEPRLPQRILTKPKDGFPSDMMVWLRQDHMRDMVCGLVADPNGFSQSYLDGAFARQLVEGHFDGTSLQDVLVWNLLALEIWHRTFAGTEAAA